MTNAALLCGWQVRPTDQQYGTYPEPNEKCIIAIGDNATRKRHNHQLLQKVIHPEAFIEASAQIGAGTFVEARACVGVAARVGRGAIINLGAKVAHDCRIGDWAHIAPGATLCGGVTIGEGCLIGANAVIRPGVTVCSWAVVGCGSVIVSDITAGGTYVGNPAHRIGGGDQGGN